MIIQKKEIKTMRDIKAYKEKMLTELKEKIGEKKVLLALSGGVDCSVCAALLSKAVGKQLTCVYVDHGLMRKNETSEVREAFADRDLNLIIVNAADRFLAKLKGVTEPEAKRKIIGEEFIRVFEEEAKKLGDVDFLAQGTILSDVIESKEAIKSHHNVGGLPDCVNFRGIIEPVRELYKYEVRELCAELGMPDYLVQRKTFPGPGLAIRIIGEITKERLDILREADYIFREELAAAGQDKDVAQVFAVLTDLRAVGVKDGKRTYGYVAALRAVKTSDYMNAEIAQLPYELLKKVSARITSEVEEISRVVYDITDKPPGTIEWE
jgi:GMP synthase (glutamine-hydrolysing)